MVLDFDMIFNITNVLELVLSIFTGWLFIWEFKMGVVGIGVSRCITEGITCAILLKVSQNNLVKDSFSKAETLQQIFYTKKFWGFVKFEIVNSAAVYFDYLGYEIATILTGIYGDQTIISAWVSVQAIVALVSFLNIGFADVGRLFVGYQIGKKSFAFGKKLAWRSMLMNWIGMVWISVILMSCSGYIAF